MKKIFLLCAFLFLLGCGDQKTNDDVIVDYGPQTTSEEILKSVKSVSDEANDQKIEMGQYVDMLTTQQALGTAPYFVEEIFRKITNIDETETATFYYGTQIKRKNVDGKIEEEESPFYIKKQKESVYLNSLYSFEYFIKDFKASSKEPTYHKLSVTTKMIPVPALVEAQPDCGNTPNCKIRVTEISFDEVIWEPTIKKNHYLWQLSPDVPNMAFIMKNCISANIEMKDGSQTLVAQCLNVINYKFKD